MSTTYTTSIRPENSTLVDIISSTGSVVAHAIPAAEAAERIARIEATAAERTAKVTAYAAAGMQVIRDASDKPRAARFRHMNRVAVVRDGEILAHYASIDDVPAIEAPAPVDDTEAATATPAPSYAAHVATQTAEIRREGYVLTDGGATQIFDHS